MTGSNVVNDKEEPRWAKVIFGGAVWAFSI
jgi:hypothetical protein